MRLDRESLSSSLQMVENCIHDNICMTTALGVVWASSVDNSCGDRGVRLMILAFVSYIMKLKHELISSLPDDEPRAARAAGV